METATNEYETAIADYNKAIELNPKYAAAYAYRGRVEAALRDVDSGLADEDKSIDLDADYAPAYLFRGCRYSDMHRFKEALEDLHKFCDLDRGRSEDYAHFYIWLIEMRTGQKALAMEELQNHLQTRRPKDTNDWPVNIAHFLTGTLPESELLKAAENSDKRKNDGQHCEAWFYAGSKRLMEGDMNTAMSYFTNCVATQMKDFVEYRSATAELESRSNPDQVTLLSREETAQNHSRTVKAALKSSAQELPEEPASAWQAYEQKLDSDIEHKWKSLIDARIFESGIVTARFRLHPDGSISDIKVSGNTDTKVALYCEAAIIDSAPLRPWPDQVQPDVTQSYRDMNYKFILLDNP